ncbi:ATP-binding protein [Massilia sp. PAMC28688]|uniref:ATP-binding protein n=1 Tax=Massilia sp. PAMC28688 TaxID=2861283 RepID=UPI001C62DAF7|nr:ATP-binding protein [Massilia sp. PAMC28688]QYF93043.1 ATP-binding protein [Massilia sp. PAMC28688]
MSAVETRPIPLDRHPITLHQYIVATPSIDALIRKIKQLIRMHTPGAIIFAYPRFGKTYGIRYVKNSLQYDYPGVVCLSCGTEAKKNPSEDAFFTTLLEAAGHPGALTGTVTRKRRRLLERIMELVDASGYNWFVMFADEAQRLEVMEYEWLRDVHDCLERRGVRMITLLVGQPQLLNQKSAFRQSSHTQIVLRFMISEMRFDGLKDADALAACLRGYDEAVHPPQSDWTFTRFFFPLAYQHGFRLLSEARTVWQAFARAHEQSGLKVSMEIPMQYFAHAVEIALETNMAQDHSTFQFTPDMWDFAVAESLYVEALTELHLGMASH